MECDLSNARSKGDSPWSVPASSTTAEYKWAGIGTEGPQLGGKAKALGQSLAMLGTSW